MRFLIDKVSNFIPKQASNLTNTNPGSKRSPKRVNDYYMVQREIMHALFSPPSDYK